MGSLTDLIARLRESVAELQALSFAELQFWHRDAADLLAVSLLGLVAVALAAAAALTLLGLPALLVSDRPSTIPAEWRDSLVRLVRMAGGKRTT